MSCFTCGKTFNGSEKDLLRLMKREKWDYYFYRLEEKGEIFICKASKFNHILDTKIKPNFKNGADYAHISEYNEK